MQELLRAKQNAEMEAKRPKFTTADKVDSILKVLLQPQALEYLNQIRKRDIETYNKIRMYLFPPEVMAELETLWVYAQRGMIRQGIISLDEVQYFERQALGISSSITIKKQGEQATSLSSFLKDEK
jgi:DNA-binding TFAR19-related protein (PDSD5 family)